MERQGLPAFDRHTLTLPWPETMVPPGERVWVQVMPSLYFRQEWMMVTASLIRELSPEESADMAAKAHERDLAYYRDAIARARHPNDGLMLQRVLEHILARGPRLPDDAAVSKERPDTIAALRGLTIESMHVGLLRHMPKRPHGAVRLAPPSAPPAEEERAFERHLLETSCLRRLFPCRAAQLADGNLGLGESINPNVRRELFATDTNPLVEPGRTISLRIHNTNRSPALFRAATFGRERAKGGVGHY